MKSARFGGAFSRNFPTLLPDAPRAPRPKPKRASELPLLGSNQDSPAPEAGVLPVTPRGITIPAGRDLPRPGESRILFVTRLTGNPESRNCR
jgi:hypothetical protein